MATTEIRLDLLEDAAPILCFLEKTDVTQVAPDAAGYTLTLIDTWLYKIEVPEACVGIYRAYAQDGDGITVATGYVWIQNDDAGPYYASADYNQLAVRKTYLESIAGDITYLTSPVAPTGTITGPLIIGDDYLATHNRAFEWQVDPLPGVSIGSVTCFLGFAHPTAGSFISTGTATVDGDYWKLSFNVTKAQSGTLSPEYFDWSVEVRDGSSNEVTRVRNSTETTRVQWVEKQT